MNMLRRSLAWVPRCRAVSTLMDNTEVVSARPLFKPGQNIEKANNAIATGTTGRAFCVIHTSGRQYKVTNGDVIVTNKMHCAPGSHIVFNKVLLAGTKDFTLLGTPMLSPRLVQVTGTVIEQVIGAKKIRYLFKRRKRYRRKRGLRQHMTTVRINDVGLQPNIDA
ncbi:large ribosomal subunit protein bL21m-like [Sycon ciliatum]|uniref:large ribosomal subunit protein bL21m-like n=1 Tax=Sycon ciliatum TaxID=27933 RepID=UPI0020AC82E0|eukprot:scpid90429/ scgid24963/ 39S ribosomal protein L21, mitochondrial